MELMSRVVTQSHQFVGGWGYADPIALETTLATVLATMLERQDSSAWTWQRQPDATGILAQLSASGLPAEPGQAADALVQTHQTGLILKRDAFGRVPLYWIQIDQVIWFASRLQLLLPLITEPEVSVPALYGYSCLSYVPTPLTPVVGIAAVPAGVEQGWQGDETTQTLRPLAARSWMEWQQQPEPIDQESVAVAQLQTLLQASIERQISDLSDQPVGVLLSGGLDSSIVAALLVQAGVKVIAYALDFGSSGVSELPYAEQVAQWLQIPLVKVDASPARVRSALPATVQALDLPFGDGVTVPLLLLNQAARRETQIIFNGEGGDQLFAGWTNKPLIAAGLYQLEQPDQIKQLIAEQSIAEQSIAEQSSVSDPFIARYLQTFHRLWGYEKQVFSDNIYTQVQTLSAQDWVRSALDPAFTHTLLHRLRRAGLMLKGGQNIQPRATNLALAQGLWVRSPFCDLPLAQWSFRLSGNLCLHGACEKYSLKRAAEAWLPPEIVWRTKRGMGVPLTSWYLTEWWRSIGDWLNPAILKSQGYWQPDIATQIVSGKLGTAVRPRRIGELLWLVIMWQLWYSQILGADNQPSGLNGFRQSLSRDSLSRSLFWLPYPIWRRFHP